MTKSDNARNERDEAAGKVLSWLEDRGHATDIPGCSIRLLAEHAQRESNLDRLTETIEAGREAGALKGPLITLDGAIKLAENVAESFDATEPAGRLACEAASLVAILSAELVAQDRRYQRVVQAQALRLNRLLTPNDRDAALRAIEDVFNGEAGFDASDLFAAFTRSLGVQVVEVDACQAVELAIKDAIDNGVLSGIGGPFGGSMSGARPNIVILDDVCTCQGGEHQPEGVQLRANDCPIHGLEDRVDDTTEAEARS
jgi:hypothetical protein